MAMFGAINLKKGTPKKPEINEVIAPLSLYRFQNKDNIIIGQNDAAMPDQPKITNQNMVRVGDNAATKNEITNAVTAKYNVTFRDNRVIFSVEVSGL